MESQVYFSINLLTTAEYSYLSLDTITAILYLVGYSLMTSTYEAHTLSGTIYVAPYKSYQAISQTHI